MTNYRPRYTTRWQRALQDFEEGKGWLFYLLAAVAAGVLYALFVFVLAIEP